jgi:hypothetical protein
MVAFAFLDRPNDKCIVNHKDGDKHNNTEENLEWVTYSENRKHAEKNKLFVPKCLRVTQYTKDMEKIKTYNSVKQAMIETNVSAI